jgi:hypothetical protein
MAFLLRGVNLKVYFFMYEGYKSLKERHGIEWRLFLFFADF